MRALVGVLSLLFAGCTGAVIGAGPGDDTPPSVAFASPAPGTDFTRQTLAATGALVADVPVQVDAAGPVERVAITWGDVALGDVDATGALEAALPAAGAVTLTATGYDAGGAEVATATVDVTVSEPQVADCHGWLDLYHVGYTLGPDNPGVDDPVTVTVPINGISYRYISNSGPRQTFFMDCALAKSLAEAAPVLAAHGVVEVDDIGVYNYRCINSDGTPPNCNVGMSQHAYAKAIDLGQFIDGTGETYSVTDDFVIDPSDQPTCTADTEPGKDTFLHQLICELKGDGVWNIVLTPNYNDLHRNHFHVDLTDGADFIRSRGGAGGAGDD
jgi:Extensin-like protein C-terminus